MARKEMDEKELDQVVGGAFLYYWEDGKGYCGLDGAYDHEILDIEQFRTWISNNRALGGNAKLQGLLAAELIS